MFKSLSPIEIALIKKIGGNGGSGGGGSFKEVTKAYYDNLSDEEKKNGTVYFIKDWVPNI